MNPKFILVSSPQRPMTGTFVYGQVWQHKDLLEAWRDVHGYCKIHGGGWYLLDEEQKSITLYGSSGDYGEPRFAFLNRIPAQLKDYAFFYTPILGLPPNRLPLEDVEWY